VTVVMNTPDEEVIARVVGRAQAPPSTSFTVAYHGTITAWYGVDLLVEAIARLAPAVPDIRGVVVGDGDALQPVRELAEEMGVSDRIELSGEYRPLEETLLSIAHADCGVIPNRPSLLNRFALSSKLFEYIALGIPVVVANLETLQAHFEPDEVTFFEAGDPESLMEAIHWVALHPELAKAKAARASERAATYGWEENSARYLATLG